LVSGAAAAAAAATQPIEHMFAALVDSMSNPWVTAIA
jgi:hypothetical protein